MSQIPDIPDEKDIEFARRLSDHRVTRVIDFRIPLPYLLSGALAVVCTLTSMYFSVQQLIREVSDLQITVKAGNTQASTVTGEIALLRFRVENLESEQAAKKGKER